MRGGAYRSVLERQAEGARRAAIVERARALEVARRERERRDARARLEELLWRRSGEARWSTGLLSLASYAAAAALFAFVAVLALVIARSF